MTNLDPAPAVTTRPSLWRGRRFTPLFITQFLGAFNDNLLKNALVVLITYRLATQSGMSPGMLVTLAAGIFILPFFLLSATAGQLADKYDRATIAQWVKTAEVAIFLLAFAGFSLSSIAILMFALFLLGVHSAFFGPVKYSVLPQYLGPDELLSGNAYIGAATFIAILLGTITGALLVLKPAGADVVALLGGGLAVLGYLASRAMPPAPAAGGDIAIERNIFIATSNSLYDLTRDIPTRRHCIAISWFWFVGATYLAQLPLFASDTLHADETVVTLMLTLFSVGIGAGALISRAAVAALRWRAGTLWPALAATGMALAGLDVAYTAMHLVPAVDGDALRNINDMLAMDGGKRLLAGLLVLATCGGAYVVPLYTTLQRQTSPAVIARTIGGLNILNALYMVASALVAMAMHAAGAGVGGIFIMVAFGNAWMAGLALRRPPLTAKNKA